MTTIRKSTLDPVASSYVLPAPPRGLDLLVVKPEGVSPPPSMGTGIAALGNRFQMQAQSLGLLLTEIRTQLEHLDGAVEGHSREQLKGAVRDVMRVVDWCDELRLDLDDEGGKAAEGLQPIDLASLCEEQANALQEPAAPIAVLPSKPLVYWGDRNRMEHVLKKALELVGARTRGQGLRCVEVVSGEAVPSIRVRSHGEPAKEIDPEVVAAFREAVDYVGATVVPDELGPGGAGLMLRLPT